MPQGERKQGRVTFMGEWTVLSGAAGARACAESTSRGQTRTAAVLLEYFLQKWNISHFKSNYITGYLNNYDKRMSE